MEIPIKKVLFSLKSSLRSHLNHSNRIRNEQVMAKLRKLVEIGNRVAVVPVELSRTWPKMTRTEVLPVQVQLLPVGVPEKCPEFVISPIFHALFHPKPNLYFKHTSKSFHMSLVISFLLNSSFNTYLMHSIKLKHGLYSPLIPSLGFYSTQLQEI